MTMLRVLLAKDLRRARRNPLPWLINLIVPLAMTALIGLAFGGRSDSGALGRIRFAVVDEDKTPLTDFLRGAASQREGGKYLEPVFLDREPALRQINANEISAVLIIPTNFTRHYLTGSEAVSLELIKNPAQSIHPAVLEELLGAVVTGLNALARNFQSEFPAVMAVFEGKADYHKLAALIERAGERLKAAEQYVNPPLVSYRKDAGAEEAKDETKGGEAGGSGAKPGDAKGTGAKSAPAFNLFAFLLVGMTGMFLLFLASTATSDLHREVRLRTFERYQTLHQRVWPFIAGKVVFAVVALVLCSAIMLGGGGLMFGIHWQHPVALLALTFGYITFAAGLMAFLASLVPDERRAAVFDNIAGMGLGLAGGCAFPPQQLPTFVREHITPLLPSYWFVDTARNLEAGTANVAWGLVALQLAVLSLGLVGLAALNFRRRFKKGLRA